MNRIPTLPDLLTMTGFGIYGANWRARLAQGLGISRMTLWAMLRGDGKRSAIDIDNRLVDLIERERDAAAERGVMLTRLRNRVVALAAKAKKREEARDGAA